MVETHGLLPTPSTFLSKPPAKKKKTEAPKTWCSYAGVYHKSEASKGSYDKIALHLRGYGNPNKAKISKTVKQSSLHIGESMISLLLSLAEQAVKTPVHQEAADKGKGRKAAAARRSITVKRRDPPRAF